MAQSRHVVLIHGYSSSGEAFGAWKRELQQRGFDTRGIHTGNYISLANEITIRDLAEGLDRALRVQAGLNNGEPFDAIVHSTGMLIIRAWLTTYQKRQNRLKHLIALAPATNGSPLAHKGRSWISAIFKGNRNLGPDFMEAGDLVLDGLELAGRLQWELAHLDVLGDDVIFGPGPRSPYAFIFCGDQTYSGLAGLISEKGTDGTVRLAGAALNSTKLTLDLSRDEARDANEPRELLSRKPPLDIPVHLVPGKDHGTIMSDPGKPLVDLVAAALAVDSKEAMQQWSASAKKWRGDAHGGDKWQQFVVRATDERGDPITDYHLEFTYYDDHGWFKGARSFEADVHTYRADNSLRCFHVNLSHIERERKKMKDKKVRLRIIATTGTKLVAYHGIGSDKADIDLGVIDHRGKWDASIDITKYVDGVSTGGGESFSLFYPFTTTFVELKLNREPQPLDKTRPPVIFKLIT